MMKRNRIFGFVAIVILLIGLIGTTARQVVNNINLGLDLQGGFEILYEVEPVNEGEEITADVLQNTVRALNRRINVLGVSEPNIQIEGNNRIRIQLAGVTNQQQARDMLATEARLTFRDVNDNLLLDGSDLVEGGAGQEFDQTGNSVVTLQLRDAEKFAEVTQAVLDKAPDNLMVIWLDFEEGVDSFKEESQKADPAYLSAATVSQVLNTTDVQITGNFTTAEAQELANLLNAGALPVELTEIYSTSVGATFGTQALHDTIYASVIGVALIFLFMLIFYRLPGIVAVITLSAYVYMVLLITGLLNAVLTLPGIAALVLGVGMAVDANIIMYERIKDELKIGRSLLSAYRAGTKRSLGTIFDANITTLLVAVVMYIYGTSSVKGFATTLIVSIFVSFITCVFGTRLLMDLLVKSRMFGKKLGWFGVSKKNITPIEKSKGTFAPTKFDKIDFVKIGNKCLIISGILVIAGMIIIGVFRLNLGIDFSSGTRIEITSESPLTTEEIEASIANINGVEIEPSEITLSGDNNNIGVVRAVGVLDKEEIAQVKADLGEEYGSEPNVSTVSPTVGRELARNAFYAVLISSAGIILYITIRFQFYYALSAVISLLHDAFFIIAIFSLFQIEVDITFIAAILTIIGYSINDTIVTFDRIRENYKLKKVQTEAGLKEIVNDSLRQTFSRSVNTVVTVLFTVVALFIFGSDAIRNFSLALLLGLIAGAYSSLFIAAQMWLHLEAKALKSGKRKEKKEKPNHEPLV